MDIPHEEKLMALPTRRPLVTAALLALCATAASAQSTPQAERCQALRPLELRILDKADQGMVPLRQFVFQTRMVHQLDVVEVADSLDSLRARHECVKAQAAQQRLAAAPR
jgi:hypothetical protein